MSAFSFTQEHEMLRQEAKKFAKKELAPGASERLKMAPMELHEALKPLDKKIVDMGWSALNAPDKYGGHQIDAVSMGVIFEECAKVDPYERLLEPCRQQLLSWRLCQRTCKTSGFHV